MIYTSTSSSSSNPLMQADLLLWNKRSRTSIRRHNDVRNMAIRELCDTEKTFVENLEYLTQVQLFLSIDLITDSYLMV